MKVLAPWTPTAVSNLWQHKQTIRSWNSFKAHTSQVARAWWYHMDNQYCLRKMQLLLKAAQEEFSRDSATVDREKNMVYY